MMVKPGQLWMHCSDGLYEILQVYSGPDPLYDNISVVLVKWFHLETSEEGKDYPSSYFDQSRLWTLHRDVPLSDVLEDILGVSP